MVSHALIEKFFQNNCTAEERETVADYLLSHPEELEKHLGMKEWEAREFGKALSPAVFRRIRKGVSGEKRGYSPKGKTVLAVIRPIVLARAACIVLIIVTAWLFFQSANRRPSKHAPQVLARTAMADPFRHIRNSGAEKISTRLPDGSQMELYPESEVFFDPAQYDSERVIHVTGKASFQVAQDRLHPFTVYSDVLATTALGTSFTVTCHPEENTIKVYLHTGKIVVRSSMAQSIRWTHDMYLTPYDLLIYDKRDGKTRLMSRGKSLPGMALRSNGAALPDWYMFDKQSLDQVFDQLSLYYGVEIDYYPLDVRKKFFTGKYERSDSLDGIIHDIALLNGLTITQKDGSYEVRRKKGN